MSNEIKIETPEVAIPEASVTLPADIVAPFQVIIHPITHDVITVS